MTRPDRTLYNLTDEDMRRTGAKLAKEKQMSDRTGINAERMFGPVDGSGFHRPEIDTPRLPECGNARVVSVIRGYLQYLTVEQRVEFLGAEYNAALLERHHATHERAVDAARTVT